MTNSSADAKPGFFARLKAGLSRSTNALGEGLAGVFTKEKLDAETISELEEALVKADLGNALAKRVTGAIAKDRFDQNISPWDLRRVLAVEIARLLKPVEKPLLIDRARVPFVILVAGVNGTGKTTTIGKIARRLAGDGLKVVLVAGDTFRAAAIEQLQIWGERTGAEVIAREPGADA